jgi:hypothetical protein
MGEAEKREPDRDRLRDLLVLATGAAPIAVADLGARSGRNLAAVLPCVCDDLGALRLVALRIRAWLNNCRVSGSLLAVTPAEREVPPVARRLVLGLLKPVDRILG